MALLSPLRGPSRRTERMRELFTLLYARKPSPAVQSRSFASYSASAVRSVFPFRLVFSPGFCHFRTYFTPCPSTHDQSISRDFCRRACDIQDAELILDHLRSISRTNSSRTQISFRNFVVDAVVVVTCARGAARLSAHHHHHVCRIPSGKHAWRSFIPVVLVLRKPTYPTGQTSCKASTH